LPQSFLLLNPGFEEGQVGWARYGGDFSVSNGSRHGGMLSGQLTSASNSTKWVYQTVVIDPLSGYEFSGWLKPQGAIRGAYLRISWYASLDGSGRALATDDSTARLSQAVNDFAFFTTGPVAPPPGARSARVRAMLGPYEGAFATLLMDDFAFLPTGPASALLKPKETAVDEDEEDAVEEPEPTPRPKATPAATRTPRPAQASVAAANETPVMARAVATRTRAPLALNSDGVETDDPRSGTDVVFVKDTNPPAEPVDHSFAIVLSASIVAAAILVGAWQVTKRKS
jgi:hypothetical protein